MNFQSILLGALFLLMAHIIVFFQINGQFLWKWFSNNELKVALIGTPISLLFLWGTKHIVEGFNGELWPGRFIGFGLGMIIYALLLHYFFNEGINAKTAISLLLSTALVLIQILWKN